MCKTINFDGGLGVDLNILCSHKVHTVNTQSTPVVNSNIIFMLLGSSKISIYIKHLNLQSIITIQIIKHEKIYNIK